MRIVNLLSKGQRNAGYAVPAKLVGPGITVEQVETRMRNFPHDRLDHKLMELSTIEAGMAAAAGGADGIFVNTMGDYGVAALRSGLKIPVVGAGQAGMHLAASLAQRFAIVTIWPERLRYLYEGLLDEYGLASRCVAIRCVGSDGEIADLDKPQNFVTEMRSGQQHMLDRIVAEMRRAIDVDGAHAILLGCTCMAPIADRLAAAVELPVVNPLAAGYKTCEMLVAMGLKQSTRTYRTNEVPARRLAQLSAMIDAALPLEDAEESDCQMCVVASAAE